VEERQAANIALVPSGRGVAVGDKAEEAFRNGQDRYDLRLVRPFAHPRMIVSDVDAAELMTQYFMVKIAMASRFRRWFGFTFAPTRPLVILHPLRHFDDGLTKSEMAQLQQIVPPSRATETLIWTGPELSDDDILNRRMPSDGWVGPRPSWEKT